MSSETDTELADRVQEWLRVDRVRVIDVLTLCLTIELRTSRIRPANRRFRIYGLPDILAN